MLQFNNNPLKLGSISNFMKKRQVTKTFEEKSLPFETLLINTWNKTTTFLNALGQGVSLQVVGWILLLAVTVYIGIQASFAQQVVSDQFISTYIFRDIMNGAPMISTDHTNIIKLIPLWIQGNFGYSLATYIGLNVAFIFGSLLLWLYLIGKIFGSKVRTIATFAFAAVLFASTSFAINITMTTLRHIEYPLGLLFIILLSGLLLNKIKLNLTKILLIAGLLAVLILNDKYFLYTLVPASIIAIVIFSLSQSKKRLTFYTLAAVFLGTFIGIILPKLLDRTGLISIVTGYVQMNTIVSFESLQDALWLTAKKSLDLFGGLIFGQQLRLRNASIFILFFIPLISLIGIFVMSKVYKASKKSAEYFVHIALTAWLIMAYAVYILSGSTNDGNDRYLTLIVFIGVTYFSWLIWLISASNGKRYWIMAVVCLLMLISIPLSVPRVHSAYKGAKDFSFAQSEAAKDTAVALEKNGVKLLAAPFGYYALKFYSPNDNLTVVGVDDCYLPNSWTNNSSWIFDKKYDKSAYIYEDQQYAPTQQKFCSESDLIRIFGQPESILNTPSIYALGKDTKIYIYNYDIRSKFDTSNIGL